MSAEPRLREAPRRKRSVIGRRRLRAMAQAAGFVERAIEGNVFGYAIVLERP